jgi:quinone-modifying oxidoreductase subunit QmoB
MNQGPLERTVLVLGDGRTAESVCEKLLKEGFPVILSCPGPAEGLRTPQGAEVLPDSCLRRLTGQPGEFEALVESRTERVVRRIGALVIALETVREPVRPSDGLPKERVWTLTETEERSRLGEADFPKGLKRVILLDGLNGVSTAAHCERLLRVILDLQERHGAACLLFTSQVKVAARELEILYGRARETGCLVIKADQVGVEATPEGVLARFLDPVLNESVTLPGDLLILGETDLPSPELSRLAQRLGLETDSGGFLQADNVLRSPCFTNRRGVLVAGPSISPMSVWDEEQNTASVVTEIHALYHWIRSFNQPDPIKYEPKNCAVCLTCYRVCPHGAIHFTEKPHFLPLACQRCGLCTSACPGEALELVDFEKDSLLDRMRVPPKRTDRAERPSVLVFACQKSAGKILQSLGEREPLYRSLYWVELPCGGTLRLSHLLEAISRKALVDGVLVIACHQDNCRSGTGTIQARVLVDKAKNLLGRIGWDSSVLGYMSTASNEVGELKRKILAFQETLRILPKSV